MTTRTVIGTYRGADGQPLAGRLYFAPISRLVDDVEDVIVLPVPAVVDLDSSGTFTIDLLTTDSALPDGWVWEVTERVGNTNASWLFELPGDPDPLDLVKVAPAEAPSTEALLYRGPAGLGVPSTAGADEGDVLQLFGPSLTPSWSDNLSAYGNRIDGNDIRLNNLEARVAALEAKNP